MEPSLIAEACDYAIAHGIVMGGAVGLEDRPHVVTHAPFCLEPSPFPEREYRRAVELQPHFNALMDKISCDYSFLKATLAGAIQSDSFTAGLWQIYEATRDDADPQKITLGLFRSDYMLHDGSGGQSDIREGRIKQVEINTIAASFGSLGTFMSDLHLYFALRGPLPPSRDRLPRNGALDGLAAGIAHAWRLYCAEEERRRGGTPPSVPVVMMVVQPGETNSYDQRHLEHRLWEAHGVRLVRRSLSDVAARGRLDAGLRLTIDGNEIAVAYFRAGYTPRDFPSESEWNARLIIERSRAIKCPNIAVHLAGAKKVQQAIAGAGVLERFVSDPSVARRLRESFTGLYSLDEGHEGDAHARMALERPSSYVLKPQREGGGNNIYGSAIVAALQTMTPTERSAFILMDLIQPPSVSNIYVRRGVATRTQMVGELGIFGAIVREGDVVLRNDVCGHLLRSKPSGVNDGGVAAGVAVLDSPLLV